MVPSIQVIKLTNGQETLVDEESLPLLANYKWCLCSGYAAANINGEIVRMHNLLLPAQQGLVVDHINQNKLDNRKSNLRYASRSTNAFNSKIHKGNTSGHRGVNFHPPTQKWRAYCTINYKTKHLGFFSTKEEAIQARQNYERTNL